MSDVRRTKHRGTLHSGAHLLPRSNHHHERADQPRAVQWRPGHIDARGHAQDVDAVCRGENDEASAERPPEAAWPPTSYREHRDDHRDEDQVANWVCDV